MIKFITDYSGDAGNKRKMNHNDIFNVYYKFHVKKRHFHVIWCRLLHMLRIMHVKETFEDYSNTRS